jgi:hypothetical protein
MVDIAATVEAEMNLEKPFDASDSEQVNKSRKVAGRNRRARLDFVEGMMTLPQGRKWLWELMEYCSVHGSPVVQGDTHATYFNLGQQNIGKRVLADVQEFSALYVQMVKEAKENR